MTTCLGTQLDSQLAGRQIGSIFKTGADQTLCKPKEQENEASTEGFHPYRIDDRDRDRGHPGGGGTAGVPGLHGACEAERSNGTGRGSEDGPY